MNAGTAFYPRPPRGPFDWVSDFVREHDPRTAQGAMLYVLIGLVLGFVFGGLR